MRPEEIVDARFRARAVRDLRSTVLAGVSHEDWRRVIRDTYPTSLSKVGRVWIERFGSDVDWTGTGLYDEARREDWARGRVADAGKDWRTHLAKFSGAVLPRAGRVPPVVVAPEDQDEVYTVQRRAGRMVACPRADAREVHAEHISGGRVCAGYGNQRTSSRGL